MQRKNGATNPDFVLTDRTNRQLQDGAKHLAGRHRRVTAHLVAHLAEIYARKLHVAEGFDYLGDYCVVALGLSEDEGHRRAHAAVLAQKYPVILDMLLEGSLHLTSLRIIGKCLTPQNHRQVLQAARGKKKTELEHLAAVLDPKPDVPTVLRKLPERRPETLRLEAGPEVSPSHGTGKLLVQPANGEPTAHALMGAEGGVTGPGLEVRVDGVLVEVVASPAKPPRLKPLSEERYSLQLTIKKEAHDALRELQDLLRHQVPNGDLVTILEDTIIERRDRVKAQKFGHTKRSRKVRRQESWIVNESAAPEVSTNQDSGTVKTEAVKTEAVKTTPASIAPGRFEANPRHIPVAVKREVWKRDSGRCAFVGTSGRRCSARGRLEFHHIHAYALGGPTTVENIALRCRTHNAYEGVALFGEKKLLRSRSSAKQATPDRPGAIGSPAVEGLAPMN